LNNEHIAVRVFAALALGRIIDENEYAKSLCRDGLTNILENIIKTMDEVDIEKMLVALKLIVRAYDQEICPFATALIGKLSASYVKLIS
jgi:hypothetical protein